MLFDVLVPDPRFHDASRAALRRAYDEGALLACQMLWAEVRAHFPDDTAFEGIMRKPSIRFGPIDSATAERAGEIWRGARRSTARHPRTRVVADFLVGAHALRQPDAFLTRDDRFFRLTFAGLRVIAPSAG